MELPLKEDNQIGSITQEGPLASATVYSKKTKPRAIIFKANDKDLHEIKELIKTHFPKVEIIYVTTGPAASTLHVTKSLPFEMQNSSAQPFYTIE
jgi:hypothetical protein